MSSLPSDDASSTNALLSKDTRAVESTAFGSGEGLALGSCDGFGVGHRPHASGHSSTTAFSLQKKSLLTILRHDSGSALCWHTVGDRVGVWDGAKDGEPVGVEEGADVGDVGALEGEVDGLAEGDLEGLVVGASVGLGVSLQVLHVIGQSARIVASLHTRASIFRYSAQWPLASLEVS